MSRSPQVAISPTRQPWYRSRLSYRADQLFTAVVASLGGLLGVLAGAQPTGSSSLDGILVFVSIAFVIVTSGVAPWWLCATAGWLAGAAAFDPTVVVVGALGCVVGVVARARHRDEAALRAVSTALTSNALIRSDLDGFFGLSALIGVGVAAIVVIGSVVALSPRLRLAVVGGGALVVLAVAGALIGLGLAAQSAVDDVADGVQLSEDAAAALSDGEFDLAADLFEQSSRSFAASNNDLTSARARPAAIIPAVAQNLHAGVELSAAARRATDLAAASLRSIDTDSLSVEGGRIDLDAVSALETPLVEVRDALADLRTVSDEVKSPWLVAPLRDKLQEFDDEYDENEPQINTALDAIRLVPDMLGGSGSRRYLLLFTTPAEARGVAGFVGNFAEITIDDGAIELTDFGRRSELEVFVNEFGASCAECPADVVSQYGRFGVDSGPDGGVDSRVWSNITMSSHFPDVAATAATLYPQSGGRAIEGVVAMDPYVLQALMNFTGSVDVDGAGTTVGPDNAAEFILRDQYVLAGDDAVDQRIDGLATLAQHVTQSLLFEGLPDPFDLVRALGPLVEERRLMVWVRESDEQALLEAASIDGAVPDRADGAGFSVSINNAGANKIDAFLQRATEIRIAGEGTDQRLVASVTLTNAAPTSGLPSIVIGNEVGLPIGTNRMLVTFYGPGSPDRTTLNGDPIALERGTEVGWTTSRHFVDVAAGATVVYELEYPIDEGVDSAALQLWEQPLSSRE